MNAATFRDRIAETIRVLERLRETRGAPFEKAASALRNVVRGGGKILVCGNGGSAADAQHMATELVVRYLANRKAIPAIALTTDTSALTACANDLGFEQVFSRQVEALGRKGDALVAISTSGTSANIVRAVKTARERGLVTIGLTGEGDAGVGGLVDHWIAAPSAHTPNVQEAHLVIEHLLCEAIEAGWNGESA